MIINQAVILAAGKGTRMGFDSPKVMIHISGKPLLEHAIEKLVHIGITEIVLIVGYKKQEIINYFSDYKKVRLYFVEQKQLNGTAIAVKLAEQHINNDFLVINGDVLFEEKAIRNLIDEHNFGEITIMSQEVEDARPYGVLMLKNNKIIDLIEKPKNPPSNLINAGFYVFPKKIFSAINNIKISARGEYEITDAIKFLIKQGIIARPINYFGTRVELTQPSDIKIAEDWLKQTL
jgi:dTDP-glucose pyrophosphorylase